MNSASIPGIRDYSINLAARLLAFIIVSLVLAAGRADVSPLPDLRFPVADGPVFGVSVQDGQLFLGGNFSKIGPRTGAFAAVDPSDGHVVPPTSGVQGSVLCSIGAPDGTVYIGGAFVGSGGLATANVARLASNSSPDPEFSSITDGRVLALALEGDTLFVGGDFSFVNGVPLKGLAAVDRTNGRLLAFPIEVDGPVMALAIHQNLLYVAGAFTHLAGESRQRLGAVDLTTGKVTEWNPEPDALYDVAFWKLAVDRDRLYAAGDFNRIAGAPRNFAAAFDLQTGALTDWNPGPSGLVHALAFSPDAVYLGGEFSSVGTEVRNSLGAVDRITGSPLAWAPAAFIGPVYSLAYAEGRVFAGGEFLRTGVQGPDRLVALDALSGVEVHPWDAVPGGLVLSLLALEGKLYVGGAFDTMGGVIRSLAAAVNLESGETSAWDPHLGGQAISGDATYSVLATEDSVYLGGRIQSIGGEPRDGIGRVTRAEGSPLPFNNGVGGVIDGLVRHQTNLFALGYLTQNGFPIGNVLVMDSVSGADSDWQFQADGPIHCLAASGGWVYLAGQFQVINGECRQNLAAFDLSTRQPVPWNPSVDGPVTRLAVRDQHLIAIGSFQQANGEPRQGIAVFDSHTGNLGVGPVTWEADQEVGDLVATDDALYFSGSFTRMNQVPRAGAAAVDLLTGETLPWNPLLSETTTPQAWRTVVTTNRLILAGAFETVAGIPRPNLAVFPVTPRTWPFRILSPVNDTNPVAGSSMLVEIELGLPAAEVDSVLLFAGTNQIAEFSGPPYSIVCLVPKRIGSYLLTAVVRPKFRPSIFAPAVRVNAMLPPGYQPPTVVIKFPVNGATYPKGDLVMDTELLHPSSALVELRTYLDSDLVSVVRENHQDFHYVITDPAPGVHTVSQFVVDEFGVEAQSELVSFTINAPPTLTLTSPPDRSILPSNEPLVVEATVSDATDPVQSVTFFDLGVPLGIVTSPPYRLTLTNPPVGKHAFHALAKDLFGETAVSKTNTISVYPGPDLSVVVDNTDPGAALEGSWSMESLFPGFIGTNYAVTTTAVEEPGLTATYTPTLPEAGYYDVDVRFPDLAWLFPGAGAYSIQHQDGVTDAFVFGVLGPAAWHRVASSLRFGAGTSGKVVLSNVTGSDPAQWAFADAVRFSSSMPPFIVQQPIGGWTNLGLSFNLNVITRGATPQAYQWFFNGEAIPGATLSSLRLDRVQPTDAGRYSVMITNVVGTVFSEEVLFVVAPPPPPRLVSPSLAPNGTFSFELQMGIGRTWSIEGSTNGIHWNHVTNWAVTTWPNRLYLPEQTGPMRFYRASWPPP